MSEDEFSFDAVVVGTGLAHSVVAAALARAGKRVCHVDANEFYGDLWSTLTLRDFLAWLGRHSGASSSPSAHPSSSASSSASLASSSPSALVHDFHFTIPAPFSSKRIRACYSPACNGKSSSGGLRQRCYTPSCSNSAWKRAWNEAVLAKVRSFNIDVSAKLCMSRGRLVNLLISSNIARYLEFKAVDETLISNGQTLQMIPSSKQGLLLNTSIPLRDKRVLSKFIQQVVHFSQATKSAEVGAAAAAAATAATTSSPHNPSTTVGTAPADASSSSASGAGAAVASASSPAAAVGFGDLQLPPDATFSTLLDASSLSKDLQAYVLHAMAGVGGEVPWREGVGKLQVFLQSIGVHGPTPFIVPLYGGGELAQAFCRLCAVFGGVYMLATHATPAFSPTDGNLIGVDTVHGCMRAPLVILSPTPNPESVVFRGVVIVEGNCGRKTNASVVTFPPQSLGTNESPVSAVILGSDVQACPDDFSVLHLTMRGQRSNRAQAHAIFKKATSTFAQWPEETQGAQDRPSRALFAVFFELPQASPSSPSSSSSATTTTSTTATATATATTTTTDAAKTAATGSPSSTASGIHHVDDFPDASLDFQHVVGVSAAAFARLLPGEDFLPAAPNPEDVIWAGEGAEGGEAGGESEAHAGEPITDSAPKSAVETTATVAADNGKGEDSERVAEMTGANASGEPTVGGDAALAVVGASTSENVPVSASAETAHVVSRDVVEADATVA